MPAHFHAALLCAAGLSLAAAQAPTVLASWTFDASSPVATGGVLGGSATVTLVGGGTVSYPSGASGGFAISRSGFPVSGSNATAGYQFCVSTAGYTPTTVSFTALRSGTGPRHVALGYQTSAGGAWADIAINAATAGSVWTPSSVDLAPFVAAAPALANNAAVCWHIVSVFAPPTSAYVSASGGIVGSGGTLRVDDLTVSGVAFAAAASPSGTGAATGTPTETPTTTPTASVSALPGSSESATPSSSPSASVTATGSATGTESASGTPPPSVSPVSPSGTPTRTATSSVTASATPTGSPSATLSAGAPPSDTASASETATPSRSPTPAVIVGFSFDVAASLLAATEGTAPATLGAVGGVTTGSVTGSPGSAVTMSSFPAATAGNATAGLQLCVDTARWQPTALSLSMYRSNTGSRFAALAYKQSAASSADDLTWQDVAVLAATGGTSWTSYTVPLPALPSLANDAALCFRIVSIFAPDTDAYTAASATGIYGTGGAVRVDNLRLLGFPAAAATGTGTQTGTGSSSATASVTPSASETGTAAETPSATLSPGASSSSTASTSASASLTASTAPTPSNLPLAVLAAWDFEAAATGAASEGVAAASSTLVAVGTAGASTAAGDAGSGNAVSLTGWAGAANATSGLQFCVSTLDYEPVSLAVTIRMSSSGAKHKALQVRSSAAAAWVDAGALTNAGASAFETFTLSLAAAVAADASLVFNPAVCFRIVIIIPTGASAYVGAGGSFGATGTMRIDNLQLLGRPADPPSASRTPSVTPSPSATSTSSATATSSVSVSTSASNAATPSITPSSSASAGSSASATPPATPSASASASVTPSASGSGTPSATAPPTPSPLVELVQWDFETSLSLPSSGVGAAAAAATAVGGVSTSSLAGAAGNAVSMSSFPAAGTGNGTAGLQFCFSSDGYAPSQLRVALRRSGTGSKFVALQVRSVLEAPWAHVALLVASGTAFEASTVSLAAAVAADSMLANNAALCMRLVAVFAPRTADYAGATSAYGPTGTLRVDSLIVSGRAVPPSSSSPTRSKTPSASVTPSGTPSPSSTGSVPASPSGTGSASGTPSQTPSLTASPSGTPSASPTASSSGSSGATPSDTATTTASTSASASVAPSASGTSAPTVVPVVTLAAWSFEGSSLAVDSASVGASSATAAVLGGLAASYLAGSPGLALSLTGFPAQGAGSGTAGAQFCVSTMLFAPTQLRVAVRRSSSASRHLALQARAAPGGGWVEVAPLTATRDSAFEPFALPLNATEQWANLPSLCLRLVAVFAPATSAYAAVGATTAYGPSGTLRLDNVAVLAQATTLPSVSATPSVTGSPSATASFGTSPSETGTASATGTPPGTPSITASPTRTPTGSASSAQTSTPSVSGSRTGTPSASGSRTGTPSTSGTRSASAAATGSSSASVSATTSATASVSATSTETSSPSTSATETSSASASITATPSGSASTTGTPSGSASATGSGSPSASATRSGTPSPSNPPTSSSTGSATRAPPSGTGTKTRVPLPSASATRTKVRANGGGRGRRGGGGGLPAVRSHTPPTLAP